MAKIGNETTPSPRIDPLAPSGRSKSARIADVARDIARERGLTAEPEVESAARPRLDGRKLRRQAPRRALNVRVADETFERLYDYCDTSGAQIGVTVEKALIAFLDRVKGISEQER